MDPHLSSWLDEARAMGFLDVPPVGGEADAPSGASEVVWRQEVCSLGETRCVIQSHGSRSAPVMFLCVGSAAFDRWDGQQVVGDALALLHAMIEKGLKRAQEQVFVSWVTPVGAEHLAAASAGAPPSCRSLCAEQVEWVAPQALVLMGAQAVQLLCPERADIAAARGQWIDVLGRSTLPTFHPSFLLSRPDAKGAAWRDLRRVMERLEW